MLRPTPGDPWGVEQHHWNTGAEENQQLNPGGPSNRQKSSDPMGWVGAALGGCAKAILLVTDNRRSRQDSPFSVIRQHRKFEFGHHRQSKKNKQCPGTDNAAITDFIFCYSTNQSFKQPNYKSHKKDLATVPSSFFEFLYNRKLNLL